MKKKLNEEKLLFAFHLWHFKKIIRIMKLTFSILLAAFMQVDANVLSQTINYKANDVSIEDVFNVIKDQTGYVVFYNYDFIDDVDKIDVDFKDATIDKVLETCLNEHDLSYIVEDKTIVITEKEKPVIEEITEEPPPVIIKGKVVSTDGSPLPGANVFVSSVGGGGGAMTNSNGEFELSDIEIGDTIMVSFVGYKRKEIAIKNTDFLNIVLEISAASLDEVVVYSTGYQKIAKERATGSFEMIDNDLFNIKNTPDIESRLENLVPGLMTNGKGGQEGFKNMIMRGTNDLGYGDASNNGPLIVLDNLPYYGDIGNINPSEVESITFLRDAAASSIWGVRAANGVIVITTKKASLNKTLQISFNSNINITDKPNLYSDYNYINSSDFIDLEIDFFGKKYYDSDITSTRHGGNMLSPVVQILAKQRDGEITEAEANAQIDAMRNYSYKDDLLKYVYRKSVVQQYSLNISDGNDKYGYYLSANYKKDKGGKVFTHSDQVTLRTNLYLKPIKNLSINTDIYYTQFSYNQGNNVYTFPGTSSGKQQGYYPYARLADDEGNHLPLAYDYRIEWAQEQGELRGLDWTYVPLDDLNKIKTERNNDNILLNLNLDYKINSIFSAKVLYQYESTNMYNSEYKSKDSYKMRDLINKFRVDTGNMEVPIYNVPVGDALDLSTSQDHSQSLRGFISADKAWNGKHYITGVVGVEASQQMGESQSSFTRYGYNDERKTSQPLDFNQSYMIYNNSKESGYIPTQNNSLSRTILRTTSVFGNIAYTYLNRYTLTASARQDGTNLFGVKANQKFNPLWSAGASWNISSEKFYKYDIVPLLKLRATYGYSGNVNTDLTADMTIYYYGNDYYTGRNFAGVRTLPNSELRWMKVGMFNLGLDFALKNNILSGYVEYYSKKSVDIYSPKKLDPTTGDDEIVLNAGEIKGKGFNLNLTSKNIEIRDFKWTSNLLFSYQNNKVTKFIDDYIPISYLPTSMGGGLKYYEGYDPYSLFSYKFAGLDSLGNPMGYDSEGNTTTDLWTLLYPDTITDVEYHGSSLPKVFGSFRNTINWKGLEFSFNITYRFNYYFRNKTISYYNLYNKWGYISSDVTDRWMEPGDEAHTTIPSMPANITDWSLGSRDQFYQYSTATVAKADNIRLQDISLAYTFSKPEWYVKNLRVYFNISNVGILWRANDWGIDPDNRSKLPKIYSFGLTANF